ncbi:hypothetical protein TPHA_0L01770 [Tetrapisispora phaffii CBS 4417]|uniref:Uncharacterized protein n=1 Tax=Tetrapisispora phaffii (strain ATCC 24235 / CBS 4417 / NBRC 1672 / NRRL Y-8282 / UCD 70-5) TaxID=1071381 RepID=G8C052_TETPH|nr:hypothetical protein TPHA_0L01770 [Tetrapisispora phaffii CBS 4417]CCE65530.1 hypothetical protein TPHA_0L01770 [Tetrapisispora phaffii CBS 4417]
MHCKKYAAVAVNGRGRRADVTLSAALHVQGPVVTRPRGAEASANGLVFSAGRAPRRILRASPAFPSDVSSRSATSARAAKPRRCAFPLGKILPVAATQLAAQKGTALRCGRLCVRHNPRALPARTCARPTHIRRAGLATPHARFTVHASIRDGGATPNSAEDAGNREKVNSFPLSDTLATQVLECMGAQQSRLKPSQKYSHVLMACRRL